jgi:hypothetical protein
VLLQAGMRWTTTAQASCLPWTTVVSHRSSRAAAAHAIRRQRVRGRALPVEVGDVASSTSVPAAIIKEK